MNQMNHLILICGEVIHLPITQNRITEIIAIEVAAERDQPTLAEVHWDTQMTEVMEEMVVIIIHTILIKAMTPDRNWHRGYSVPAAVHPPGIMEAVKHHHTHMHEHLIQLI